MKNMFKYPARSKFGVKNWDFARKKTIRGMSNSLPFPKIQSPNRSFLQIIDGQDHHRNSKNPKVKNTVIVLNFSIYIENDFLFVGNWGNVSAGTILSPQPEALFLVDWTKTIVRFMCFWKLWWGGMVFGPT